MYILIQTLHTLIHASSRRMGAAEHHLPPPPHRLPHALVGAWQVLAHHTPHHLAVKSWHPLAIPLSLGPPPQPMVVAVLSLQPPPPLLQLSSDRNTPLLAPWLGCMVHMETQGTLVERPPVVGTQPQHTQAAVGTPAALDSQGLR